MQSSTVVPGIHPPVIGVVISCVSSGVHVVPNQPVEVDVTADSDLFHLPLREIGTICIEVPQDHDVLKEAST